MMMHLRSFIEYRKIKQGILVMSAILILCSFNFHNVALPEMTVDQSEARSIEEMGSAFSTSVTAVIGADSDDDTWQYTDSWTHLTNDTEVRSHNESGPTIQYALFRWSLNIPNGATITSATMTLFEIHDETTNDGIVERIDETNVGPLESDGLKPNVIGDHSVIYNFDNGGWDCNEWGPATDITAMVQDQVSLPAWLSGYFFGVQIRRPTQDTAVTRFEDYQHSETHHAYLSITFTGGQEYQEPDLEFLHTEVTADSDDDYWNLKNDEWTHVTDSTSVPCRHWESNGEDIAQFRFQLDIPPGAIIHEATFTVYELYDDWIGGAWIRRIDETNVGPLESDTTPPSIVTLHQSVHAFDRNEPSEGTPEWVTDDITDIVQDQVNTDGWQSGYSIGLQLNHTGIRQMDYQFEDYQHTGSHHAYIDVTFTDPAYNSWLSGWDYRKSHVVEHTVGAGSDYTLPIYASLSDGSDYDNMVFLDGKSLPDFADIRFTSNNGTGLLDYTLQQIVDEYSTDYFVNYGVDIANYPKNYPAAYYYNGRTYVALQGDSDANGDELDIYIMYYDHATDKWSGVYYVGYNPCPLNEEHDLHGPPCLWVDNTGFIHVLYGAHDSNLKHSISDNPEDITSWTLLHDIDGDARISYPHIEYDPINDVVHLSFRHQYTNESNSLGYIRSTDNGLTWSDEQTLISATPVSPWQWPLVGQTSFDVATQTWHFGWRRWDAGVGRDVDIHYAYLDVNTGHLFNARGLDLGTTIDWNTELDDCVVYDSGSNGVWGPAVHIDSSQVPYIIYTEGTGTQATWFTYWNSLTSLWTPRQQISSPGTGAGANDFIVHSSNNITAFVTDNSDIQRYTWDGSIWTWQEELYDSNLLLAFSTVPKNCHHELQVIFSEYVAAATGTHVGLFAWGSNGRLDGTIAKYAKFYVKIPGDLDATDQVIYIYYGRSDATSAGQSFSTSEIPWVPHGRWGSEEEYTIDAPTIDQAPTATNLDDVSYLYARAKAYEVNVFASDPNGATDIAYLELTLFSDNRVTEYWSVRYYEGTSSFLEYRDPSDCITLDADSSKATSNGNNTQATFHLYINWNHPDITNVDVRCSASDDQSHTDTTYYETDWNVETRLEFSNGPVLIDGQGTADRGGVGEVISASGSIAYHGSVLSPLSSEIDVYVISPNVQTSPWYAQDYDESSGAFSAVLSADDEVGQETYRFKVVEKGESANGADLSDRIYTRTYIADSILADISVDEGASNETTVCFIISLHYAYDAAEIADFTAVISRNGEEWLTVDEPLFMDERDTENTITYDIMSISENTHGLTITQGPVSPFVLSEEDSGTNSTASIVSLEAIRASLMEILSPISALATFLGAGATLAYNAAIYMLNLPHLLVSPEGLAAILPLLLGSLILFPITSRSSQRSRLRARQRNERKFRLLGGLDVYTLLPMKGGKTDLRIIIDGSESSFLVLDTSHEIVTERLKLMLVAGKKPKKLLKLYSTPIKGCTSDLILLGLILDSA